MSDKINLPPERPVKELVESGEREVLHGTDFHVYPSPYQPMSVAERLVSDLFTRGKHQTLKFWRGDWWHWSGPAWEPLADELEIKKLIWARLGEVTFKGKGDEEKPWAPTTSKVANLMEPVKIITHLSHSVDAPAWVEKESHPEARHMIVLKNGCLDFTTGKLLPPTPALFATWALPFVYDPAATCPVWMRFLGEVFGHDPAGQELLQQFMGYLISGRTDMQKALLMIGPPGGGKGTISRVVWQLVGVGNIASPTLHSLGGEFGMENLVGKPLAIFQDARQDESQRNSQSVERLLNIIGEDAVSVNRKGIKAWEGNLPTRFILFSNVMPRFLDSSGAIKRRFMSVRLKESFTGNPDTTLGKRLAGELPGIFNWALEGLEQLNQQGHFTQPETMEEMQTLMGDMASPVAQFLGEQYDITGDAGDYLEVTEVHGRYKAWYEEQGYQSPPNRDTFIQRVLAAEPSVSYKNTLLAGSGRPKARWFFGMIPKPFM